MKNKQLCLMSLISTGLFLQTAVNASPLVSIGDNADVYFNGSSSLRWVSNVFRNETNEVDDLIWTLSPGFELNVGRGASNADLSITTRYDIIRYHDNDMLDTELFHIKAVGSYRGSRLDLNGSVSFDESKTNSGQNNITNDLIEFDTTAANLNAEYRVSPKFSFGSGVRYSDREYQGLYADRFADRERVTVPLDVFYELTPKVDLSLGYAYTETDVGETLIGQFPFDADPGPGIIPANQSYVGDYGYSSHFFNVGARGSLLPKLNGFFKVGYRTRSSDDSVRSAALNGVQVGPVGSTVRDDTGMLGLDADLNWAASPKLTVRLGLSRDFGVGGEGQSTENSTVNLSGSYSINSYFAASANFGYTLREYSDGTREDDQYNAGLRLSYSPNQYWSFSTGYTYMDNSSNQVGSSYENHTLDLTATLRY